MDLEASYVQTQIVESVLLASKFRSTLVHCGASGQQQSSESNCIWAPVKILYIWVVAIVMVLASGRAYPFPGLCGNQHIRDPTWNPNPFLNRLRWFPVLRQHFMFLSCCIDLPACSFIFLSFACIFLWLWIHFLSFPFSMSIYVHSNLHSCPLIFPSFASMFLSTCIHVPSFPFQSNGNGSMAWQGNRVQQMVIAKVIAK